MSCDPKFIIQLDLTCLFPEASFSPPMAHFWLEAKAIPFFPLPPSPGFMRYFAVDFIALPPPLLLLLLSSCSQKREEE